ncbi:MAG: DUF3472 domain-containing protein [Deltaproteobacteria bacterium]|nr:DUF3472 domain-containing protein [Deltaproteobacteria bacterium]
MPPHVRGIIALAIAGACTSNADGKVDSSSSSDTDGTSTQTASTTQATTQSATTSTDSDTESTATAATDTATTATTTAADDTAGSSGDDACGDGVCSDDEDASSCCLDCGVCDDGATVRMQTGVEGGAPGSGLTPGGMADTHAYFAGGPFAELVYPFTITDEPVDGSSWFWAQQFFFDGTDQGGYTGVQANGILGGQVVGKMLIGSIWDATAAVPGPQASCEPFGGEGVGYSCRLAYAWRENVTYRMIVREEQPQQWSIAVHDPTIPGEILLGTITTPAAWGRIHGPTAGFAEYYGETDSCDTTPYAVALLHAPLADGTPPTGVDAGTYGTCMAVATSSCTGPLCQ